MSEINNETIIKQEILKEQIEKEKIEKVSSLNINKTYWFMIGHIARQGIFEGKDKHIINNYIMRTKNNIPWSVPLSQIFITKEQCEEYMKNTYPEYFNDIFFME